VEEAHLRQNASGGSTGSTMSGGRLSAYKNAPDCVLLIQIPRDFPHLRARPSGGVFLPEGAHGEG